MPAYIDLVGRVRDAAVRDAVQGTQERHAIAARAQEQLPELLATGELSTQVVAAVSAGLLREQIPPVFRLDASKVNLAAARLLGAPALAREAARVRAALLYWVSVGLEPRSGASQRASLAREAIDLATEFDLESVEPRLIAELYLQAGNADVAHDSPLDDRLDLGLQWFLKAYPILQRVAPHDAGRLAPLMTSAAREVVMRTQIPLADRSRVPERLQVALKVFETLDAKPDQRRVRLELLREQLALHAQQAAQATAQALQSDEELGPRSRRELTMYMADLRSQQSRPLEALEFLDRIEPPTAEDDKEWPYVQIIRANSLRLAGRLAEAEASYQGLTARLRPTLEATPQELGPRVSLANALTYLGITQIQQGRVDQGLARFDEVDALFAGTFVLVLPRLEFLSLAAGALWDAGRLDEAGGRLDAAVRVRDGLQQAMQNPIQREAFLVTWAWLDQRRAALVLRRGDAATAFEIVEDSKSRVLRSIARSRAPRGTEAQALVASLGAAYSRARAELAESTAALTTPADNEPGRRELLARIRRLRRHVDALQALVEERSVEAIGRVATAEPSASVAEQADLILGQDRGGGWAIVSYVAADDGIGIVVRTTSTLDGVWLDTPTYPDLRKRVLYRWQVVRDALRAGTAAPRDWDVALAEGIAELSEHLVHPIERFLRRERVQRLAIVPHRSLHLVPFGALADHEGLPLAARFRAVCVLPSVNLAAELLRRRQAEDGGEVSIFAAPDANAPLIGVEAALITALWQKHGAIATCFAGPHAHPVALFESAPQAGLLHLACHGLWQPDDLRHSGLSLSAPPADTVPIFGCEAGLVTLSAILGALDLKHCLLTILSACDSGLAQISAADDPLGLPFLLALAGSRSVIASLWPVPDEATMLLMIDLHRRLAEHTPAADALAQAQTWLRALSAEAAAAELSEARVRLASLDDMPDAIRPEAAAELDRAIARVQASADKRPYADFNHWAAFSCTGL